MPAVFYSGLVFIWLPLWFLVSEFNATSEQNAVIFPHFSVLNNIAVLLVELAGIALAISGVSRAHWVASSISILSSVCGSLVILGLLFQLSAKLGLIH
jgi:hypothetical protein